MIISKKMWEELQKVVNGIKIRISNLTRYCKLNHISNLNYKVVLYTARMKSCKGFLLLGNVTPELIFNIDCLIIEAASFIKSSLNDEYYLEVSSLKKKGLYESFIEVLRLYIQKHKEVLGDEWVLTDEYLDLAAELAD